MKRLWRSKKKTLMNSSEQKNQKLQPYQEYRCLVDTVSIYRSTLWKEPGEQQKLYKNIFVHISKECVWQI